MGVLIFIAPNFNLSKTQVFAWYTGAMSFLAPILMTFGIDLPQAELVELLNQVQSSAEVISAEVNKIAVLAVSVGTGFMAAGTAIFRFITSGAAGFLKKK